MVAVGLGLVLLGVFPPGSWFGRFFFLLSVFSFSGDVPRTDHFPLVTAGVTFQLLDGRDVGSKQVHRPKNRYLQVSLTCNSFVRVSLRLSEQWYVRQPDVTFSSTGPWRQSSLTCYEQVYLRVQLPSCSVHMKLHTSPYIQTLLESFSYVPSAFLSTPRSRERDRCVDEQRGSGQHWTLHLTSSSGGPSPH